MRRTLLREARMSLEDGMAYYGLCSMVQLRVLCVCCSERQNEC